MHRLRSRALERLLVFGLLVCLLAAACPAVMHATLAPARPAADSCETHACGCRNSAPDAGCCCKPKPRGAGVWQLGCAPRRAPAAPAPQLDGRQLGMPAAGVGLLAGAAPCAGTVRAAATVAPPGWLAAPPTPPPRRLLSSIH